MITIKEMRGLTLERFERHAARALAAGKPKLAHKLRDRARLVEGNYSVGKFNGEALRRIRGIKGVGRPPVARVAW